MMLLIMWIDTQNVFCTVHLDHIVETVQNIYFIDKLGRNKSSCIILEKEVTYWIP